MASPPAKKSKESTTISMVVEEWKEDQTEQFSSVHRVNGYPWRTRLYKDGDDRLIELRCEKSSEAELWQCAADIAEAGKHTFKSWCAASQKTCIGVFDSVNEPSNDRIVNVEITTSDNGDKWNPRPIFDPRLHNDAVLLIGEEKQKIHVNKKILASQSPFFNLLFFGNNKEKNTEEFEIEDVEFEEFSNILKIMNRADGGTLNEENIHSVLQLSDRFELKIVEECAINYLLSTFSSFSIHQKLHIAKQYNLTFLKDQVIEQYTNGSLMELLDSPEWDLLSKETVGALLKRSCDMKDVGTEKIAP